MRINLTRSTVCWIRVLFPRALDTLVYKVPSQASTSTTFTIFPDDSANNLPPTWIIPDSVKYRQTELPRVRGVLRFFVVQFIEKQTGESRVSGIHETCNRYPFPPSIETPNQCQKKKQKRKRKKKETDRGDNIAIDRAQTYILFDNFRRVSLAIQRVIKFVVYSRQ